MLVGRLLQGFSAGVELGGVSIYLFEIATPGNKGFYTSFQSASQQVAIFVAAHHRLSSSARSLASDAIAAWGWRIPFFIGCLIVPFIFVIRALAARRRRNSSPRRRTRRTPEILRSMLAELADDRRSA